MSGRAEGWRGVDDGDATASRAVVRTWLACLVVVARYRGAPLSVEQIERDLGGLPESLKPPQLVAIASRFGLRGVATRMRIRDLTKLNLALPAMVLMKDGTAAVLAKAEITTQGLRLLLQDPNADGDNTLTLDETRFGDAWTGQIILIKRKHRLTDEKQPFSLNLIVGMLLKNSAITRDIALSAIFMSLLALSPIVFWRILIDRVLYYHASSTFYLLTAAMAVLIVFEMVFGYLRRFLVNYITRDIDVALTTLIFNRLLDLPIDFFEKRQTGEIARDANEVWKIRKFLTGELFGTLLDAFVIFILLPVMFFFSAILTWVVLGLSVLIFVWLLIMLPIHRVKAGAVFRAEGVKSSFLIETLHGMRTIKSLALEPSRRREWDELAARAAEMRYDESRIANIIQTYTLPLERAMTAGVFALAIILLWRRRPIFPPARCLRS